MKNKYLKGKSLIAFSGIFLMLLSFTSKLNAQSFSQNFEDFSTLTDWWVANLSDDAGTTNSNWFRGRPTTFIAQAGTDSSYIATDYHSDTSLIAAGTISNWLITPNRLFNNGDVITFYTRTTINPATYPDNMQVRFSANGASTYVGAISSDVGDFSTLLLEINPALTTTGYPGVWTMYTITMSGLSGPTSGRVAFRYYCTNGGPVGANSLYIGIDTYSYTSNTSSSDATVTNVYTLGTIAKPYINPHQVKAVITNSGTTTLINKVVTLNVTGANTFTNTQTIASLASGASTTVTFAGYTSNITGTNTVTVSVPADAVATGNSFAVTQTVNTTSYNYAYGTAETGNAGFNSVTGDVAAKFSTSSATSINTVNVNLNTVGEPYTLRIWDATGAGGTPGTLLYSSSSLTSAAGIIPVTVSPACAVNGAFFVGISQTGINNIGVAYQTESPIRTGSFYFQSPTGANTWTDFSTIPTTFRVMIEPVFGCAAPATPGSVSGTLSVCQGSTNSYSVSAVSGATSYTWTLPSGWSGTSTTNTISATAGAFGGTISVTANNTCGSSSSSTTTVTILTSPATPGSISGTASVCQSSSNTYSVAAVSGATSYTWALPGGWSGTSTTNSITATAGASGGTITVTANNACGSSTASSLSVSIAATPAQPGSITGTATVCQTSSQTYSVGAVAGATSYTWTLPAGWSGNSTTNSITATVGANGGTISVTANNNCGSGSPQVFTVIVNQVPAQPGAITGGTTLCQGISQTYTIASVAGATSYTWTLPGGWSGTSTTNTIVTTTGANSGTISVTANNACGSSSAQTLAVTISSTPVQPGAITGNTTFCPGQTLTYSITPMAGASSYTWTLPAGWAGTSTTNSITATSGANGGIIQVTYSTTCGVSPAQQLVVSLGSAPLQPGAITGNTTFCPGDILTYSIGSVAGATSYTWSLPGSWTGTSTSTSIIATAGGAGGVISVTATNACGTSPTQVVSVSLGSAPSQPGAITGNNTVCSGINQNYSVSPVAGAVSYTWSIPNGWAGASTTNSITTIPSATGGILSVVANNACGISSPQLINVVVNSIPAQPASITGSNSVCSGISGIYSITPVTGATGYTWTLPSGWSGTSSTNSITATAGASSGTISVTVTNSCGTSPAQTLNVTSSAGAPAQAGVITGSGNVCSSSSQTYSVSPVANATSYTWSLPVGWSGTSTTNSITYTVGTTGGTISVIANNGCGSSPSPQTLAVTVSQSPNTPGAISGLSPVCAGATGTYFILNVPGATSYTWTLPSGWLGTSTTTAISTTAGASGTISVTANNSQCSSPAQTLSVTVNTTPSQPTTITGSSTVCAGATETYFATPVSGASSYNWTFPAGWSGSSTLDNIALTAGTTGGNITVTAANNCGTSAPQSIAVSVNAIPAQPGAITGNTNICLGSNQTYSIAAVSGATSYSWTLPSGWSGSSSSTSITAVTGLGGGTISVMAMNGACAGTAQTLNVTFTSAPAQPGVITGPTSICAGSSNSYSIAAVTDATSYTWTLPSGWSGTSTTTSITATAGTSTGNITVAAVGTCGTSSVQTLNVVVNALPATPIITPSGNTLSSSSATGNHWYHNGVGATGADSTSQFFAMTGTGFYYVIVTDGNGCSSQSATFNNTGISENELNNLFSLYPNPTHNVINITLNTERTIEAASISNVLGKTVKVINAKNLKGNTDNTIDVKDLDSGIYFLTLQVEGRVITKKIVID